MNGGFAPQHWLASPFKAISTLLEKAAEKLESRRRGYVTCQTGWLSDRSLAYLACGRPVVALDTGWSRIIGVHEGLRAFQNCEQAAAAILEIEAGYADASASAMNLSTSIFSASRVIGELLRKMGISVEVCMVPHND